MAELPRRPKPDVVTKPNTLSTRGAKLSASGAVLDTFKNILGNPFDPDLNPGGIINIGTAENYLMVQDVADFAGKNLEKLKPSAKDFSYGDGPWGSPRLREAMSKHINRYFKPLKPIEASRLLFANGVTSLCEMLGFSICDEGNAILLSKPMYQAFKSDFGAKAKYAVLCHRQANGAHHADFGCFPQSSVQCVFTNFHGVDQFSLDAVAKYKEAIEFAQKESMNVRALIICNPHNPLGRCYPPEVLMELMQLCDKYKIHFVADEIYALSVYRVGGPKSVQFQSILTLDIAKYIDHKYVHLLYGMSKDMASGGLRVGCIYSRNEELLQAMGVMSAFHWPPSSSERVAALMLEDEKWMDEFLDKSRRRLVASSNLAKRLLDDEGIEYYEGSNAGFFLWIKLLPQISTQDIAEDERKRQWASEDGFTSALIENGVYLINGKEMNAEEPGWYRFIFAQDEIHVREGVKRIAKTLESRKLKGLTA